MNSKLMLAGFAVAAAISSFTFAQEPAQNFPGRPAGRPERMGGSFMQRPGMQSETLFYRMLERPEFISKLGLPEEKVKILQEGFEKISAEENELFKQRTELLKNNSKLLTEFMADRTKTADVLEQSFVDIEALQTKISKLTLARMILIRDNLDEEQIKNASETVKKHFEERRKERMQRFGEQGGNGPRRFGGREGEIRRPEGDKGAPAVEAAPAAEAPAPAAAAGAPVAAEQK